jgi:hypothetical protein
MCRLDHKIFAVLNFIAQKCTTIFFFHIRKVKFDKTSSEYDFSDCEILVTNCLTIL